jgi:hypothetical protein
MKEFELGVYEDSSWDVRCGLFTITGMIDHPEWFEPKGKASDRADIGVALFKIAYTLLEEE